MFWGDRYAQLEDPFEHRWSVATHKRDFSAVPVLTNFSTKEPRP